MLPTVPEAEFPPTDSDRSTLPSSKPSDSTEFLRKKLSEPLELLDSQGPQKPLEALELGSHSNSRSQAKSPESQLTQADDPAQASTLYNHDAEWYRTHLFESLTIIQHLNANWARDREHMQELQERLDMVPSMDQASTKPQQVDASCQVQFETEPSLLKQLRDAQAAKTRLTHEVHTGHERVRELEQAVTDLQTQLDQQKRETTRLRRDKQHVIELVEQLVDTVQRILTGSGGSNRQKLVEIVGVVQSMDFS